MLKKIILALAALGVSSAALAHDGRGYEREHERWGEHRVERFYVERRPVYVAHRRPVIVEPVRRVIVEPAPRVVYAAPPVAYRQPAPSIDIHFPL